METQTAYCKRCKRNTRVTHFIPRIRLISIPIAILSVLLVSLVMGPSMSDETSWGLTILLMILFPISFTIRIPSNGFYCETCGSYIGQKSEIRDRCVYCDAEIEPGVTFCPKCGKKLTQEKQTVTCKKCGTENTLEATYCVKCGAKLPASRRKKSQQPQRTEPVDKQEAYGWQYWE